MSRFCLPRDIYHGKGCLEELKNLKGMQAHVTCDVADVDLSIYANLGIMITYDANKK